MCMRVCKALGFVATSLRRRPVLAQVESQTRAKVLTSTDATLTARPYVCCALSCSCKPEGGPKDIEG